MTAKKTHDGAVEANEKTGFVEDRFGRCRYVITDGFCPVIYGLYVWEEDRRKGHATRLLKYIIDEIRREGYDGAIGVEVAPTEGSISTEDLAEFYERHGLVVMKIVPDFFADIVGQSTIG